MLSTWEAVSSAPHTTESATKRKRGPLWAQALPGLFASHGRRGSGGPGFWLTLRGPRCGRKGAEQPDPGLTVCYAQGGLSARLGMLSVAPYTPHNSLKTMSVNVRKSARQLYLPRNCVSLTLHNHSLAEAHAKDV